MAETLMQQYYDIKSKHKDTILFFRVGDFYETFYDDAKKISKELNIVLTSRNKEKNRKIPLAGIPYHAIDNYLGKLIDKGYKVAICEQVEDPKKAKGLVKREVVRIVTPGTVMEDTILKEKINNFLVSIVNDGNKYGVTAIDTSTGEFFTTQIEDENKLQAEILRYSPSEIIIPSEFEKNFETKLKNIINTTIHSYDSLYFDFEYGKKSILEHFDVISLKGLGLNNMELSVRATSAALSYIKENQQSSLNYINFITPYKSTDYMVLDYTTLRNLEIIRNLRGEKKDTLLSLIDKTETRMGSRVIAQWLQKPLLNVNEIDMRLNVVDMLYNNLFLREDLRNSLKNICDIERVVSKIGYGNVAPRDLIALKNSLKIIPEIKKLISDEKIKLLQNINSELNSLDVVITLIEKSIVENPPNTLKDVIKTGYSKELDELREARTKGKKWIIDIEKKERSRTKIKNLKIKYNDVFGYFIEVTKANLKYVPEDYIRKQTLTNVERFITPELKEKESMILAAREKISILEKILFNEIREKISTYTKELQKSARAVGKLDALRNFAEVAVRNSYTKPKITNNNIINIKAGRHAVVEHLTAERFIPNDIYLDCENNRLIILTGPNMAGKSTYMREIALIIILAQIGSFVPAESAEISIVDRIFTRVGAMDNITEGQSTFMTEMVEVANILNSATSKSFIILDEVGRGTSTFDGLSIAWAIAENIHDKIKAKTIFATHYHHLIDLEKRLEGVKNYHISVKESEGDIVFIRKVLPDGMSKSYGIQVAKLAGVPHDVIEHAKKILIDLEDEDDIEIKRKGFQSTLFKIEEKDNELKKEIKKLNMNDITPLEALNILHELKKKAEK